MAKNKQIDGTKKRDDRSPARMVRVLDPLAAALDAYCARNVMSFPQGVNQAVRELLERAGYWPPKEV